VGQWRFLLNLLLTFVVKQIHALDYAIGTKRIQDSKALSFLCSLPNTLT
jgi:hypothetical protein